MIIGGGGHASVLVDVLRQQQREIIAVVSLERPSAKIFDDIRWFRHDSSVLKFDKDEVKLVNGVGSLPGHNSRALLFQRFVKLGYEFETVVATSAVLSKSCSLAQGVQVMPGAIIQTGVTVGENSIINTGAIIEHDCEIGGDNHVAPGVTLSGGVQSLSGAHFGTGCSVIQKICIGENAVVGAGAVLSQNLLDRGVCYPARVEIRVEDKYES